MDLGVLDRRFGENLGGFMRLHVRAGNPEAIDRGACGQVALPPDPLGFGGLHKAWGLPVRGAEAASQRERPELNSLTDHDQRTSDPLDGPPLHALLPRVSLAVG